MIKNYLSIITVLVSINFASINLFASECDLFNKSMAQSVLDSQASRIDFKANKVTQVGAKAVKDKIEITKYIGAIYRANYTVEISTDDACALKSVKIYETKVYFN